MKKSIKYLLSVISLLTLASCANTPISSSSSSSSKPTTATSLVTSSSNVSSSSFSSSSKFTSVFSTSSSSTSSSTLTSTSSSTSTLISSSSTTSSTQQIIQVKGNVQNCFDGNLDEVTISSYSTKEHLGKTDADGNFNFEFEKYKYENDYLAFEKEGYDATYIEVSSLVEDVECNVELSKKVVEFGRLEAKSWPKYEAFVGSITRSSMGLGIILHSDNQVFLEEDRNSNIEIYISTGSGTISEERDENVTKINIRKDGSTELSSYNDRVPSGLVFSSINPLDEKEGTTIYLVVSYDAINATKDDIMGISMGLWSEDDKDWAPMISSVSNKVAAVEKASQYVRFDKNNTVFTCEQNCYPEDIKIEYNKEELIKGYNINFANPLTSNKGSAADDIYAKFNKTETGFDVNMIGFGTFADTELVKLILHTSDTNGSGWGTVASDVTFLINKNKAAYKTGLTDFWAYVNFAADESTSNHTPIYNEHNSGYFELSFSIDFSEIPEYSEKGKVSVGLWEFENGVIYDATPFTESMYNNGTPVGDLAMQGNYVTIQEKMVGVDKNALTEGYDIQFSKGADNIYAKVERKDEVLKLNLISFTSKLNDNSFIRFIVKSSSDNKGGWGLDTSDVDFVLYKNAAYVSSGKTGFWENEANQFHGDEQTLNEVNYKEDESGEYWTLSIEIDYSEIGASCNKETPMTALLIEFTPSIQNNGFSQNGETKGDVADQSNYFEI